MALGRRGDEASRGDAAGGVRNTCRHVTVTPQQYELVRLRAQGISDVEIAAKLGTTVRNAKARLTRMFRRLL